MRIIDLRPPRIAMALTFIAAAVHWSLNLRERMRFSPPGIGAAIGIIGFFLMMWSWWLFKEQRLAVCLTQKTAHIITKAGPYRFSRNPMYLGMILMLLGLALYVGTLPFYVSAVGYFAILNFVFVPFEEKKLLTAFGDDYASYNKSVRRWI